MWKVVDVIIHFSLLFIAIIAYLWFQKRRPGYLHFAAGYLIATVVIESFAAAIMLTDFLADTVNNNLFLYHFLTPIQYCFLGMMYASAIKVNRLKHVIECSVVLFVLISISFTVFVQPLTAYNSYTVLLNYVMLTVFVLLYLKQMLVMQDDKPISRKPLFWISTGILFHSVGNIFLEGVSNYLISNMHSHFLLFTSITAILNYLLFLSFLVAFIVSNRSESDTAVIHTKF